jgi:hypothetical protein
MLFKAFRLKLKNEIKADESGKFGLFSGHAAVFGNEDAYGDIIQPGAFTATINSLKSSNRKLKMLWQHDYFNPIGIFPRFEEDRKGLSVDGEINLEVAKGAECYALMKQGAIDSLSIGYETIKDEVKKSLRFLLEVKLWEASPVTFEANNEALLTSVKMNDLLQAMKTGSEPFEKILSRLDEIELQLKSLCAVTSEPPDGHSDKTEEAEPVNDHSISVEQVKNLFEEIRKGFKK